MNFWQAKMKALTNISKSVTSKIVPTTRTANPRQNATLSSWFISAAFCETCRDLPFASQGVYFIVKQAGQVFLKSPSQTVLGDDSI